MASLKDGTVVVAPQNIRFLTKLDIQFWCAYPKKYMDKFSWKDLQKTKHKTAFDLFTESL